MATILTAADNTYDSQTKNQRDIITQSVLSIALGLAAFLAFCVSRSKQITIQITTKLTACAELRF